MGMFSENLNSFKWPAGGDTSDPRILCPDKFVGFVNRVGFQVREEDYLGRAKRTFFSQICRLLSS